MAEILKLSLNDGDDVYRGLDSFAKENDIKYGFIVSGGGGIREYEVSAHGKIGSVTNFVESGRFSVDRMHGTLERSGDRLLTKLNVLGTGTEAGRLSGELMKGRADRALEIGIRKVDLKKIIHA